MTKDRRHRRQGMAILGALVTLAIVSSLLAAIAVQHMAMRRQASRRVEQLQARWLARSGIELASARLRADPAYRGETIKPLPNSSVQVTVTPDEKDRASLHIRSEARYPTDAKHPVNTTIEVVRKK